MAFVIFIIVKSINKLNDKVKKPEEEAAPTTKVCPFCKSEIAIDATKCPHCTSSIEEKAE
jgi:large conductance mechanosensitive channel